MIYKHHLQSQLCAQLLRLISCSTGMSDAHVGTIPAEAVLRQVGYQTAQVSGLEAVVLYSGHAVEIPGNLHTHLQLSSTSEWEI